MLFVQHEDTGEIFKQWLTKHIFVMPDTTHYDFVDLSEHKSETRRIRIGFVAGLPTIDDSVQILSLDVEKMTAYNGLKVHKATGGALVLEYNPMYQTEPADEFLISRRDMTSAASTVAYSGHGIEEVYCTAGATLYTVPENPGGIMSPSECFRHCEKYDGQVALDGTTDMMSAVPIQNLFRQQGAIEFWLQSVYAYPSESDTRILWYGSSDSHVSVEVINGTQIAISMCDQQHHFPHLIKPEQWTHYGISYGMVEGQIALAVNGMVSSVIHLSQSCQLPTEAFAYIGRGKMIYPSETIKTDARSDDSVGGAYAGMYMLDEVRILIKMLNGVKRCN